MTIFEFKVISILIKKKQYKYYVNHSNNWGQMNHSASYNFMWQCYYIVRIKYFKAIIAKTTIISFVMLGFQIYI